MARAAPASARAAEIVSFLTAHPARGFTISELARHLGMNIASAHATLAVLTDCGFVVRDQVHRTYVLGPALAVTGFAAMEQHPAIGAAIDQSEELAGQIGAEVGVMAAAGRDVILLARRGPALPASGAGYPGDRSPLLAPIGAVFMAWETEEVITQWLERAALSAPLADMYRRVLAEVRQRGFSVALPDMGAPAVAQAIDQIRAEPADDAGEQRLTQAQALLGHERMILSFAGLTESAEVTFMAIAAPVFDPLGRALLSLYIAGSPRPVPVRRVLELGARLAEAAATATGQARGRPPSEALPPAARAR
jgi:DNA-binding IclR family transcriptional regulator